FSQDGRTLASAHDDAIVELWETATGLRRGRLASPNGMRIKRIAFSPDGKYLAAGGCEYVPGTECNRCAIWLWNLGNEAKPRLLMEKLGKGIKDMQQLAFGPDSKDLLLAIEEFNAGGWWATVTRVWDPDSGELKREIA